jgi:hypothetical protein
MRIKLLAVDGCQPSISGESGAEAALSHHRRACAAASRVYRDGGDSVIIELPTDSPVMQGLGRLLSGGLVTGSDNKLLIIGGRAEAPAWYSV